ncbi:complex I subunit 5 family protein [Roseburia hominis]
MKESLLLAVLVFYPFIGGLLVYAVGRKQEKYREYLADFVAVSEFVLMLILAVLALSGAGPSEDGLYMSLEIPEICGFGMTFTLDGFRVIYGLIAGLMWTMTTVLSGEYFLHHKNKDRFYLFLLWTLGAVMGVFLSADLFTTFIFFEIMSFTSYVWVAQEENEPSLKAAETYLAVAVIGGLVMLMGLFLLYHELGTLTMTELLSAAAGCENKRVLYAAGACLFVGFGAKAGAVPLHIWLPKAHPVAPAPASALLSGILTKTGLFGILVISASIFQYDGAWGRLVLVIGVLTMFGGALLAVFSVDLKRTLACSSMSQVGFILVGLGMQGMLGSQMAASEGEMALKFREGYEMAVHGSLLHMVNHSLIKLVLFMAAGVIFMNAHALNLNRIRGYGRKKPLLKGIFLVGALAIAGIPLFGGYISKTLIHESIATYGGGWVIRAIEYVFLISGGLTLAYMTKLFVAVFVEENEDEALQEEYDGQTVYMNKASTTSLSGAAAVLLVWGLFPHGIMDRAAELSQGIFQLNESEHVVSYFSLKNLSGALISIVIGGAVYMGIIRPLLMKKGEDGRRSYIDAWPVWLDLENLIYRPLLLTVLPLVFGIVCRIVDSLVDWIVVALRKSIYRDSPLPYERTEGNVFTEALGKVLNFLQMIRNLTWGRKKPSHKDYVHIAAMHNEIIKESNMIIQRSLSFGLLLFCIGLCLTLVYIIWW